MGKLIDLTGQRFGRLVVIGRAEKGKDGHIQWLCKCDCGKQIKALGCNLRYSRTNSCGCYRQQFCRVHGEHGTRLYKVWDSMKQRCSNPNRKTFKDYGGRGITVCPEWEHDFTAFRDWALANGYDKDAPPGACTLDRIDNDAGYSPQNCRWVTAKIQKANQRASRQSNIPVQCVETGVIYPTIREAAQATGAEKSCISAVIAGKRKSAGGYTWRKV